MAHETNTSNLLSSSSQPSSNMTLVELLNSIRHCAIEGKPGKPQMNAFLSELKTRFPFAVEKAQGQIEIGQTIANYRNMAYQKGAAGHDRNQLKALYLKLTKEIKMDNNTIRSLVTEAYQSGLQAHKSSKSTQPSKTWNKLPKTNSWSTFSQSHLGTKPVSTRDARKSQPFILDDSMLTKENLHKGIHPNFLGNLSPAKSWTVMIDETGLEFSIIGQERKLNRGRIVAVIIPDSCILPPLPRGYHAYDEETDLILQTTKRIISSECGVLGISVKALHALDGNLWYVGVETLIDLIIRLLPIDGKTFVNVLIEQRDIFTPEMSNYLKTTLISCLNHLSRSNPHRAESINLDGDFIRKDEHPWNGYADTVAYCWGGTSVSDILAMSGWKNSCLLDSNPGQLVRAVDLLLNQKPLSAQQWENLINRPDALIPNSLTNVLLKIQGEEAQADAKQWNTYLEQVQRHLYSKAINMKVLGLQIDWLKTYTPQNTTLSKLTELVWLTTQLAQANHLGRVDLLDQYMQEFQELCVLVYPENAPLVCLTLLHVAVSYINNYDFQRAYDILEDWINIDEAVPGRKNYSALLSTLGQLNAFNGNLETAIEYFDTAIDRFETLINPIEAKKESNQTSAYKVTAMMDSNPTPENMESEMERYLGRKLENAAIHFATTDNLNEQYMHHIFLRYLVHVNSQNRQSLIDEYMSHSSQWKNGDNHPWEMILYYRGLLQSDVEIKKAYLNSAYRQTPQIDGVMSVIACVILGSLYFYDSTYKEELEQLTLKVVQSMPNLGDKRIETLTHQIEAPVEPLELAKIVLPFNFR